MEIEIRRVEPGDYKAVQRIYAQPRAIWGTKKRLAEAGDQIYGLVHAWSASSSATPRSS